MHQVQLSNEVYKRAERRAAEAGYKNVDEYVAEVVNSDADVDNENLDHLFTPERLAHIDDVLARVKAGEKTYTMDEVRQHLEQNRADWIQKNGQ
jgi:hypothetical protein